MIKLMTRQPVVLVAERLGLITLFPETSHHAFCNNHHLQLMRLHPHPSERLCARPDLSPTRPVLFR
jgi:hypothetical protein